MPFYGQNFILLRCDHSFEMLIYMHTTFATCASHGAIQLISINKNHFPRCWI